MSETFRIGERPIGREHRPFVIAEMSGNHNQSLDRALGIVEDAARAGAHAIKLQTYTADTMTLDLNEGAFRVEDPKSLWAGRSLYELYQEAATPYDWHAPILKRAADDFSRGRCSVIGKDHDGEEMFLIAVGCAVNLLRISTAALRNDDLATVEKLVADGDRLHEHATGVAAEIEDESLEVAELIDCVGKFTASRLLELRDMDVGDAGTNLVLQVD